MSYYVAQIYFDWSCGNSKQSPVKQNKDRLTKMLQGSPTITSTCKQYIWESIDIMTKTDL
jgi:hypothetical protein